MANPLDRQQSRDEKGQPLGPVGFSIASLSMITGATYAGFKYFPRVPHEKWPKGLKTIISYRPWERHDSAMGIFLRDMKNAGIAVRERWKILGDRDNPIYDPAKDRTSPWFIRENYRSGISLKPTQLSMFEQQLDVAHSMVYYAKIDRIRRGLEGITDPTVKREVWQRINAIANRGGYVNHIGTISDVIDLITSDEKGNIRIEIDSVVKAGRAVEGIGRREATTEALANISSLKGRMGLQGITMEGLDAGRLYKQEYDKLFHPAIEKALPKYFRGQLGELSRATREAVTIKGDVRGAIKDFYDQFKLHPLDPPDAEAFKNPAGVLGTMRYGSETSWVPAPEKKMFEDIVAHIHQRTGRQFSIRLAPLQGPLEKRAGAIIEIVGRGGTVRLAVPFTTPAGFVSMGRNTRIGQVSQVTNRLTGEIEMTQLSGYRVMENIRGSIDLIFAAMQRGDYRRAQSAATKATKRVMEKLPEATGTIFDVLTATRVKDQGLSGALGRNVDWTARKRLGRYLNSMERLKALNVEKGWISFDTETTIRSDGRGMQRIWNIAGMVIDKDGRIDPTRTAPMSGFVDPGKIWEKYGDVDAMFRGEFGSKYHHISLKEFKEIKRSPKDSDAVKNLVEFFMAPENKHLPIVVHNKDFDIPLLRDIYNSRRTRPGESIIPFSAFEGRVIDTYDLATGFIDKSKVRGFGIEGIIRGFASIMPDLPQDYREIHLAFQDSADLRYIMDIMQKEFKGKTRLELAAIVTKAMRDTGHTPYLDTALKVMGLKAAYKMHGNRGMQYSMGITGVSSSSAAEGFFSPLSTHEMMGYTLPYSVFDVGGKKAGNVIRSSGSLHALARMPNLRPESRKALEKQGALLQGFTSLQAIKFQRRGMRAMAEVTPGGEQEVAKRVGYGKMFPMATIQLTKDPIFFDNSIVLVKESFAKAIGVESRVKTALIRNEQIPTVNGVPDVTAFNSNLQELVKRLNATGGDVVNDDIVKLGMLNPRDPLITSISREGGVLPRFDEKYRGKVVGLRRTPDGIEVSYRLALESDQLKGYIKAQMLVVPDEEMELRAGNKAVNMLQGTSWGDKNPDKVFHGSVSHAIHTIEKQKAARIVLDGHSLAANREARKHYSNLLRTLREAGILVAHIEDVPELVGKDVIKELGGGLVTLDSPEGLPHLAKFTDDTRKALRAMGLQDINIQQLDYTKITDERFQSGLRQAQSVHRDFYHSINEVANVAEAAGGIARVKGVDGLAQFIFRLEIATTAETMKKQMFSAVPIGASAKTILTKGMRWNPDMMRRFDDLLHVNQAIVDSFGRSSEEIRKDIAPAVEMLKHYVHASSRRAVAGSGLTNAFMTTLRMSGLIQAPKGTPTYEWVKGKGWVNKEGTVRSKTFEALREMHGEDGFMVRIPTFGKASDFMVLNTAGEYTTLEQQTGNKLYVPGSRVAVLTETSAWGGQKFSYNSHLERKIMEIGEVLEKGKSHHEVVQAVTDYVKIAAEGSLDKHGYVAALQSGYVGGVLQGVLAAPPTDLFFSNIPKNPEINKLGGASLRFLNFAKMPTGTVYITEAAAKNHLGDARFAAMKKGKFGTGILQDMRKGGFFTPDNAQFAYTAMMGRYPVLTPSSNISPINIIVLESIGGKRDASMMVGDPSTLRRMQGDHDGDITKLFLPPGFDDPDMADMYRRAHKAAQLNNIEHLMGAAESTEVQLSMGGKQIDWRGTTLWKGQGGKIFAADSVIENNPDGRTYRREIKFYRTSAARFAEGGTLQRGYGTSEANTRMVINAKQAAAQLTKVERASLEFAGWGLMKVGDVTIRDNSGGAAGLVKKDAAHRSWSLTRMALTEQEFIAEMENRGIMKAATKIAVPQAYMAYQGLLRLQEAVTSRAGIADIAEKVFLSTVQFPAIGAKHQFPEAFERELKGALWAIAEKDETGEFTAAAKRAHYKFSMGDWDSFKDYTKEAKAGMGIGEAGANITRDAMLYGRHEWRSLNEAIIRGAQGRGGMFQRVGKGEKGLPKLIKLLFDPFASPEEGGYQVREMLRDAGALPMERPSVEAIRPGGLAAESFGKTLDRNLGYEASRYLKTGGKIGAGLALLYAGVNFFRPNQMGMLGPMPGRGGEVYDTGFSGDELPRGVPLDIPMYTWESKARVMAYEPGKFAKNMRIQGMLFDRLGIEVATPQAMRVPGVHMTYQSNRSSDPQLQMYLNNAVRGEV